MRKRTFIIGLACWLGFFALGVRWVFNPYGMKINFTALKHLFKGETPPPDTGGQLIDYDYQYDLFVFEDFTYFGDLRAVSEAFPIHLARFENSGIREHADQIANEDPEPTREFNYLEWAFRESCSRFVVFMLLWGGSGWSVHWLTGRIIRGPGRLVR